MEIPVLSAQQIGAAIQGGLENRLSSTKAVCFDFFDTLVRRSVVPEDTKKIAAHQLADFFAAGVSGITGDLIYHLRQVLEQRLCSDNYQNGFDPECNLIEVAQKLYRVLQEIVGRIPQTEKDFVAIFISIELAVEKQLQTLNHEVVEILRYCQSKGMLILIVSDFYIPAEYFRQLLLFHGLADMVDKLIVSADFSLTKGHSGRLYDIVSRESGCAPETMIMVGDNVYSDGIMARRRGMFSYCLQQPANVSVTQQKDSLEARRAAEKVYAAVFAGQTARYFPEMGLSLYYFIHNLFLQAVGDSRDTLFFCSKEGEFLQKLFVRYQELRFGRQVIDSRYLVVSRKATFICSCRNIEVEDFERLFVHYRDLSITEFLQSLNFSEVESLALCEQLRLEPHARRDNLRNHPDFQTLTCATLFRSRYEAHRLTQRENFFSYLKKLSKDALGKGLVLVDVGWKGSIQNNIYLALDGKVKVSGYYIGLLSPTECHEKNEKTGILFADVPAHSPYIHVFNNNRSLFEMVLGASHGSADGYFSRDQFDNLAHERQGSFFQKEAMGEHPLVTVLDLPAERELFMEQILPLQQAYYTIFEKLTESMMSLNCRPDLQWFARHHARMLFAPTKEEVDFFARLYHLENYGVFEFTSFADNGKISFRQQIENIRKLLKDPAGILETGVWPPIIFRRLGLSWLQPVDGMKRYRRIFKGQR